MPRVIFQFVILLVSTTLSAQQFQMRQYKVTDGLPSDVVKGIQQDTLGFFWIATDDGIVKFDGLRFTTYKDALHSQYAKGFLKTRKGRLLLFGDLDLIEIDNRIDTVIFKSIRQGARNPTDTMLWYPKSLYEDLNENIWVGEPQSIVRLKGISMKRFNFPISERSPQFLRSFSFFEDEQHSFYTVSYFGTVYKYNEGDSTFVKQTISFPTDVNLVKIIDDNIWICGFDGLYASKLLKGGGFDAPKKIFSFPSPYDFQPLDKDHFIIATSLQTHAIVDIRSKTITNLQFPINNVNTIYISNENDIWISSSNGLVLLQRNLFLNIEGVTGFVESIAEDTLTGSVFFCTMEELYKVQITSHGILEKENFSRVPRGYFQSLIFDKRGLWASNAFSVLLYQNGKLARHWNFENEGRFIHDIFLDTKGNIWLSQAGNESVLCIKPDFKIERYKVPVSREGIVSSVREGRSGVFVTSNGKDSYLFFKDQTSNAFKNISLPVKFKVSGDFSVVDLVEMDSTLWLASSEGLLKYDFKKIEKVNLSEKYSDQSVKSVKLLQEGQILFVNAMGVFRYEIQSGNFWLYDEGNGIASNAITTRGLFVGHDKRVWVGTSRGLSYSRESIVEGKKTKTPFFVEVKVNGTRIKFTEGLTLPYQSFLNIDISAITFPEKSVSIQYRIANKDTTWKLLENSVLSFSNLSEGRYEIQVRARKHGGYSWSDARTLVAMVQNPFWKEEWFIIIVTVVVGLIAYLSFSAAAYFNKKRRRELENLVAQRTQELQTANDELTVRNAELDRFVYSASHDLSAPLKSMLGLVNVARKEKPDAQMVAYLDMIEKSTRRLEIFIKDVINYSRNARMEMLLTEIDFKEFVENLLADHQYASNYNVIDFRISSQLKQKLVTDEMRLRIILNNLISNAIKFHFINDGRKPFIEIRAFENNSNYFIEVEDNGRGIEKEMLDKVFQMFFRATDSVHGSGLGLYILKETITKLKGEVSVRSQVEQGTTFTIKLPKP